MVVQNAREAVSNANAYSTCRPGLCLQYVRTWLEISPQQASAAAAWAAANRKHPGEVNAPAGFPVFWLGGSQGYGHIALSVGGGKCRSTEIPSSGRVGTIDIDWITRYWGQRYQGWTEDLNGVLLPYSSSDPANKVASGTVYVSKLHRGTLHSDSVARLRYRLDNHQEMPQGRRPGPGGGYGIRVTTAVKYWQNTIAPHINGPRDGLSVSNPQANALFGPAYEVIEA